LNGKPLKGAAGRRKAHFEVGNDAIMLTDEELAILKTIESSVGFDGDDAGQTDKPLIEGYVEKDGDLFQLTAKGEKTLLDNSAHLTEQ
jgi:hypothetical protein